MSNTMDCRRVRRFLSRYQDGELEPGQNAAVEQHLSTCTNCSQEFEILLQVTTGVKTLPAIETDPHFSARVMQDILDKKPTRHLSILGIEYWKRPSLLYSLVFILFLILGFMINGFFPGTVEKKSSRDSLNSQDVQIAQLLNESQDLTLLNVQEQTLALVYPEMGTDEAQW